MRTRAWLAGGIVAMACAGGIGGAAAGSGTRLAASSETTIASRLACRFRTGPRQPRPIWRAAGRRRRKHTLTLLKSGV